MRSIVVAALALSACATNPAQHVPATGAALAVDVRDELYTYTATEQVGQVEHRDSAGNLVGTSTMTQDVQRTGVARTVTLLQGGAPVDEQDFYAIAGDEDARGQIEGERALGEALQIGGLTTLGVGGAALLVGMLPTYLGAAGDGGAIPIVAGSVLMTGGLLAASAGGLAYYYGNGLVAPGRLVFDEARAARAADAYNTRTAQARDAVQEQPAAAVATEEPAPVDEPPPQPAKKKRKKRG